MMEQACKERQKAVASASYLLFPVRLHRFMSLNLASGRKKPQQR